MTLQMQKSKGFTLIEIAIVLIIIGLLLGGVIKGRELITQARIRSLANSMNSLQVAILTYEDRYHSLPGDDPRATRWGTTVNQGNGDGTVSGVAWGNSATDESQLFWLHLRKAGLITTSSTENAPLNTPFKGQLGVQDNILGMKGLAICANKLPVLVSIVLDNQLDDGRPDDGNFRSQTASGTVTVTEYNEADTSDYVSCLSI